MVIPIHLQCVACDNTTPSILSSGELLSFLEADCITILLSLCCIQRQSVGTEPIKYSFQ